MHRRRLLLSTLCLLAGTRLHGGTLPQSGPRPLAAMPASRTLWPGHLPAGAALRMLPLLANQSDDPGRFIGTLIAAPAELNLVETHRTTAWTYNGQLPGPLIELVAGSTVEIVLENRLPQPTNLHWHGLPVPPDQDGPPQEQVPPGGRRTYRFTLPDDLAGTFWYHPQPSGLAAEQRFRGLSGPLLIRAPDDPLAFLPEQVLMVSDLRLDAQARIPANDLADWIDGREGNFLLVNGQYQPQIALPPGGQARWRVLNATAARVIRLSLPGGRLTLVGTDGGLLEAPVEGKDWLLAPGERVELVAQMPAGKSLPLLALPYVRGRLAGPEQPAPVVLAQVTAGSDGQPRPLPGGLRALSPLPAPTVTKRVVLSEQWNAPQRPEDLKLLVNGRRYAAGRIDLVSKAGEVELWEVANDSARNHPFHLHGALFQVIERVNDGVAVPEPFLAWRDTVNLRRGERIRFKVRQDLSGLRLFHSAVPEHETLGMMGTLKVVD